MKTGLVLSGGGARGIGHLGVIKALQESGFEPSIISGTSAGALVGAFFSAGYTPEEILEIARAIQLFDIRSLHFGKAGVFNMRPIEQVFKKYLKMEMIEELPIPLSIAATDIMKGEVRYFSQGPLYGALLASSCVPLVFRPVEYEGCTYLDGGILDNFPIDPIAGRCEKVVGVFVNTISKDPGNVHMRDMLDRSFHLALSSSMERKSLLCDLYIAPPDMSKFSMFNLSNASAIFEYTYNYTKSFLEKKELFWNA